MIALYKISAYYHIDNYEVTKKTAWQIGRHNF